MIFQLQVVRTYTEEVEAESLDQALELLQSADYVDWAYSNEFSVYDEDFDNCLETYNE